MGKTAIQEVEELERAIGRAVQALKHEGYGDRSHPEFDRYVTLYQARAACEAIVGKRHAFV